MTNPTRAEVDRFYAMDPMTKASVKCSACGKFRKHTEYTQPARSHDELGQAICDHCKDADADTTKALAMPVTAITANGERDTTLGKAIAPPDDSMAKAGRMARAWAKRLDDDQREWLARRRLSQLACAELSRRAVVAMKAKAAKMERRANVAKGRAAAAELRLIEAQVQRRAQSINATALGARVDQVMARLNEANAAVKRSKDAEATRLAAVEGRDRESWAFKAGVTNDPILRSAYMARAAGEVDDDDG